MSWEYRPLSYIYLVYNRNEASGLTGDDGANSEQVILKFTYLFEL